MAEGGSISSEVAPREAVGPKIAAPTSKPSVFAQFAFSQNYEADHVDRTIADGGKGSGPTHGSVSANVEIQKQTDRPIAGESKATFSQKCVKRNTTRVKAGHQDGNAAVGSCVDAQLLIDRWQSMAHGALTVELRRFYVRIT